MAFAHDAASLNAIAANSAAASRAWVHKKLGRSDVEFSCVCPLLLFARLSCLCLFVCFIVECLHRVRYSGPVEAGSRVAQKTMLRFTWQLMAGEVSQFCEVHQLCSNVAMRGVRRPKEWKNEFNLGLGAEALDKLAVSAMQRARDEFALSESVKLDCRPKFTHARALVVRGDVIWGICCACVAGMLGPAVLPRFCALA